MLTTWVLFASITFVNVAVYVMIQMFFEGHEAFTD